MTHSILDPALSNSMLLRRGSVPPQCKDFRLDDFEVVGKPLGCGSFGHVNRVVQRDTGKTFAMKVMSKTKILEFNLEQNIEREVSFQQSMQHPKILQLYKYFEDLEDIYLLLEYAPNGSVFDLLRERRKAAAASDAVLRGLPEPQAASIFRDVAEALHFLHGSGVIHRDLKPENILLCEGGVAKLADFGWCNQLAKGSAGRSTFCGTREYLSPEMIANEPYDCSVDVWAAGVLLFEMLAGTSPFAASNYVQALGKISRAAYEFRGHVSAAARDLVGRLLVRESSQRLDLGRAVGHPWVLGHTSGPGGPCCGSQQSTQTPRSEPTSSRRGSKEAPAAEVHAMLGRAVAARSAALLETAVQKAAAAGLEESELSEARRALAVEKRRSEARRRLRNATQRRSPSELRLALADAEGLELSSGLLEHAREVLAGLSGAAADSDSEGCSLEATVPVVRVSPEVEAEAPRLACARARTEPAAGARGPDAPGGGPLPAATANLLNSLRPARSPSPRTREAAARVGRRAKIAGGHLDPEARAVCSDPAAASTRTPLRSQARCEGEGLLASLLSPRRRRGSAPLLPVGDLGLAAEPAPRRGSLDDVPCTPSFGAVGSTPASASFTPRSEESTGRSPAATRRAPRTRGAGAAGVGLRERLALRKRQLRGSRSLASPPRLAGRSARGPAGGHLPREPPVAPTAPRQHLRGAQRRPAVPLGEGPTGARRRRAASRSRAAASRRPCTAPLRRRTSTAPP
ncbi:unnamed protein product [Prorocentrum cordatum]|uniref:Aurora kinase n=1 Tax=Prorocentrum cordatum TaxID=2364126 RepID=A0ABN9PGC4_9DINO|nr:unnamed protein product [Polarella glacialis]